MVCVRCETADGLALADMRPFQGDLKSRSGSQLGELKKSLMEEGLLAPFFVWRGEHGGEEGNWLLDGHARLEALRSIYEDTGDYALWFGVEFPVVYVEASGPEEARKALLQITSSYGRVTKRGAERFCASIPEYRAPSVAAFLGKAAAPRERAAPAASAPAPAVFPELPAGSGEVRITIAVPAEFERAVVELFESVSYIRVL